MGGEPREQLEATDVGWVHLLEDDDLGCSPTRPESCEVLLSRWTDRFLAMFADADRVSLADEVTISLELLRDAIVELQEQRLSRPTCNFLPKSMELAYALFDDALRIARKALHEGAIEPNEGIVLQPGWYGFHVSSARNRESIRATGLSAAQKSGTGIDGETLLESGTFVTTSLHESRQFLERVRNPTHHLVDIWRINLAGVVLETGWTGYFLISQPIGREQIELLICDIPNPPMATSKQMSARPPH